MATGPAVFPKTTIGTTITHGMSARIGNPKRIIENTLFESVQPIKKEISQSTSNAEMIAGRKTNVIAVPSGTRNAHI